MGRIFIGSKHVATRDKSGRIIKKKGVKLSKSERAILSKVKGESGYQRKVQATKRAHAIISEVSPKEAADIEVIEKPTKKQEQAKETKKIAKTQAIYATPTAARVLIDIKHPDVKKTRVPLSGQIRQIGVTDVHTELPKHEFALYQTARSMNKEELFFKLTRRPKHYHPEE